jgi:uncharacterized protein YndB with AHSA1/START domain
MEKSKTESASDRELVMSRVVSAPRELVWDAMTKPEHVVHWWGPNGFTTRIEKMEVRAGGTWSLVMIGPDGVEYPNTSVFKEVVRPERLVMTLGGGRRGGPPISFEMAWIFEAIDKSKTRVTIRQIYASVADRDRVVNEFGALEGGKQCLARLDEFLARSAAMANAPEWEISRTFDAPRKLVWQAWTDPKQMAQWWGPKNFTNPVCELDVRVDGAYRMTMRSPDGSEYPLHGFYREIVEPERLVYTMEITDHPIEWFDQVDPARDKTKPPKVAFIQMATFEDLGCKTKLTVKVWFESEAIRNNLLKVGMNEGWSMSLDRLEVLLR